ncbi:elongator complex protein 2 [Conger conger]|uniref:elongator complex protein 2 n=1 Tax=Conger conger TaxID=82655 RepID=UPI002A59FE78|nr:elongator complex protein 2 [Conger conger]
MAAPLIETCYVACCANRTPNVLSWGRSGLIAFGTCNSVAVYDPQEIVIVTVLNGHKGRVNAVQWVHRNDSGPETELVSGGSDNRLIVWKAQDGRFSQSAQCCGHSGPVSAVDSIHLDPEGTTGLLIASAASDSTVKVWVNRDNDVDCIQTISFGSGFMMDVSLTLLPGSRVPILACGGDDARVYLYVQQDGKFVKVHSLHGHEDWVRGVEWVTWDGDILLASCAQDCLIRIWKVFAKEEHVGDVQDVDAIKLTEDVFEVKKNGSSIRFAVTLETVLAGHENWVYGVHWQPPSGGSVALLSASMDKTMILWGPEEASGVWLEQVRVGEVGGNTLGFYGCQMSPDGSMIMAHAFHGALHLWHRDPDNEREWSPGVVISGHFSSVQDLSWDPDGEFVLSVGSDQTTRLFTPWRRKERAKVTWHEVSRPQIHGYDMQCLATVGRFQFVSGADEKVLRVFRAPRNFVENFSHITGASLDKLLASSDAANLPEGASTPALGLSNKAVFQGDLVPQNQEEEEGFNSVSDQYSESYFHPLTLTEPPPEDHLLQNTLWPEVQKLYGHGFEMFCLASDGRRTVVASACKASKAEHAAILLWSACSWRQLQALPLHSLTVTQLSFSPDSRFLLAVSRDRTWSLWRRRDAAPVEQSEEPAFSLHAHTTKSTSVHTRIIWSCDWSGDSRFFVTSSRDKKVIVWGECGSTEGVEENSPVAVAPCSSVLDVGDSATSISVCPVLCPDHSYLVAVGLENGKILFYKWRHLKDLSSGDDWTKCAETDDSQSHALTVRRLRWRPRAGRAGQESGGEPCGWVQLASAGADHAIKVFAVNRLAL